MSTKSVVVMVNNQSVPMNDLDGWQIFLEMLFFIGVLTLCPCETHLELSALQH